MKAVKKVFILDVDGVLTTGQFIYSKRGKEFKVFGPDDNDALQILKHHMEIVFISGDKRGFPISKKRIVDDMGFPLHLVGVASRTEWIAKNYNPKNVIYMGDGIFDGLVMKEVFYGIAPADADKAAINAADYVTERRGGERAVAEACIHLFEKVLKKKNILGAVHD